MKKLHITIILFLWCFAQVAEAQNMYRNYLSNAVIRPNSAVSVVHSNGYVYFFQSDTSSQMLSVTEIDPYSMLPTGNNYYLPTSFGFVLNGAFEGFSGDNVFSYILDNIAYEKITEYKALHVQLCKDDLLLYRDLQEDYNYFVHDIIWMTRINNFWNSSATVSESYYYLLPDAKLTAKDMIYDFENKRANLLCEFSHCVEGLTQLLAQKKIFVNGETTRKIFIKDKHQFICDGFEGNIRYWVYNMKGKLLQQGITKNGKHNLVKATKGIYLIKVSDAVGCPVVKKIVIL